MLFVIGFLVGGIAGFLFGSRGPWWGWVCDMFALLLLCLLLPFAPFFREDPRQ